MFQHKLDESVTLKTYFNWFTLSFLAGTINTGGYLACHRFVSHVTGFSTLSGISLEDFKLIEAFGNLVVPLFFLLGVIASGYLTEKKFEHKTHGEKYAPVMGIVGGLLVTVAVLGYLGWFGEFGEPAKLKHDFILLAFLCGACGLQNGAITTASGFTIRTTHLTGLTTDLGLGIVRAELKNLPLEQKNKERKANLIRVGTIFSFTVGSAVGAFIFVKYHYIGFLFPAMLAFYFSYVAKKQLQKTLKLSA